MNKKLYEKNGLKCMCDEMPHGVRMSQGDATKLRSNETKKNHPRSMCVRGWY